MGERRVKDDDVEPRIAERQRAAVRLLKGDVRHVGGQLSCPLQQRRRWVDADDGLDTRQPGKAPRQDAGATPDVQHAGTGRKRHIGKKSLPHRCC